MSPLRTLLELARQHRGWLLLGLALMLLSLAAGTVLIALSGWFITASALAGLGLLIGLDIFTPGAGIRLAAITRTLSRYGERLATHAATLRLLTDLRLRLLDRMLKLDDAQLAALRRGDTLNRLTGDVNALDGLFSGILGPSLAAAMLTLLAAIGFALIQPALSALVVLPLLILLPLLCLALFRAGRRPGAAAVAALPQLRTAAADGIEGLNELRALDRTDAQAHAIKRASERLGNLQQRLGELDAFGQSGALLVASLSLWLGLVGGLYLHERDQLSAPLVALIVLAVLGLSEAWQGIPAAWRRLGHSLAAARRVDELATQPGRLQVPGLPAPWPTRTDLVLEDVHFGYGKHLPAVLSGLNLTIGHGEQWLLSGASGIGKTTLALLLMRQFDPDQGRILLGAQDLRDYHPDELRRRIAWLPQKPIMLRDTLAANLRLARASASADELVSVLTAVDLDGLLHELPDGLETWLDEDGANLSGGQRQRVALARLLLTNPDIVLLDEPTASLDTATAAIVMNSLDRWLEGRTTVIISHDPLPGSTRRRTLKLDPAVN
ncbi:MAG: thiol reductant ABC exporter subunit CydC [Wenzhouxiangella sp.]|nr:MAG: thiol reductant ABC exporter subunit CydC [Wenzhouxiangella sp.]